MNYIKNKLIVFFLKIYLFVILLSCRWKTHNIKVLKKEIQKKRPIMLCCWHENLVYFSCFFKNWGKKPWVISSTHRDSEILASILKSWKYRLIKGSSTRGWFSVLKKLLQIFSVKESIVAITNDGPRGPAKAAKPGALKAAIKKRVTIIGMSGSSSAYWKLNSWDKMKLPKPFSTICISFYPKYCGTADTVEFNSYLNDNEKLVG